MKSIVFLAVICLLFLLCRVFLFSSCQRCSDGEGDQEISPPEQEKENRLSSSSTVLFTMSKYAQNRQKIHASFVFENENALMTRIVSLFPLTRVSAPFDASLRIQTSFQYQSLSVDYGFLCRLSCKSLTMVLSASSTISEREGASSFAGKTIAVLTDDVDSKAFLNTFNNMFQLQMNIVSINSLQDVISAWSSNELSNKLSNKLSSKLSNESTTDRNTWTALFLLASHPSTELQKLSESTNIRFLDWMQMMNVDAKLQTRFLFYFPAAIRTTAPLLKYRVISVLQATAFVSFPLYLLASHKDVRSDIATALLNSLWEDEYLFASQLLFFETVDRSVRMVCPPNLTYHEGAKVYMRSQGMISAIPDEACAFVHGRCTAEKTAVARVLLHYH